MADTTKLPWSIDRDNSKGIEIVDGRGNLIYIEDFSDFIEDESPQTKESYIEQMRACARLIVTAVNHHQELMDALRSLSDYAEPFICIVDDPPQLLTARAMLNMIGKEQANG